MRDISCNTISLNYREHFGDTINSHPLQDDILTNAQQSGGEVVPENHNASTLRNPNPVSLGLLFWIAFSIIAVFIRGVRWDETLEHGLAIAKLAPYPEAHPFYIYTRNAPSFQSYLSAALLWLGASPALLCTLRDIAQLAFFTAPVYLFAVTLSKRPLIGHLAVALALANVYEFFEAHYAIETWPGFFSVGQIGAGYALLTLTAFLAGWSRCAWFLLTSLIAVHLGQLPPLVLFALVFLYWGDTEHRKRELKNALTFGGIGLVFSATFLLIQNAFKVPLPTEGPYFAEGNTREVWLNYSKSQDVHRFIEFIHPFSHSIALIALTLLTACAGIYLAWKTERFNNQWSRIAIYALIVGVIAIGARVAHFILGDDIPFLVLGWMPYRIPNHLAPILLCVCLTLLIRDDEDRAANWTLLASIAAILSSIGGAFMPSSIQEAYLSGGEFIAFLLAGGVLGRVMLFAYQSGKVRFFWLIRMLVVWGAALAIWNLYALTCVAAGTVIYVALGSLPKSKPAIATTAIAALLLVLTAREYQNREHLPLTEFQSGMNTYLEDHDATDAMILPPIWEVEWAARTGAPVMIDYQTPRLITYMPDLGPSLRKMHRDIYGYSLDGTSEEGLIDFEAKSREDWIRLGHEYEFQFIIHPEDRPFPLEPVYTIDGMALYKVPNE